MYIEIYFINHWINSNDPNFMVKHNLTKDYFSKPVVEIINYIEAFIMNYKTLPTHQTLANEFNYYKIYALNELNPVASVVDSIKKTFIGKYFLEKTSKIVDCVEDADFINRLIEYKNGIDSVLRTVFSNVSCYSWIKDGEKRFEEYLKRHGKTGLLGYPFGLKGIDEKTGGILEDDFVLISARTGQGKSLLGDYIGYNVWNYCCSNGINKPVVCINTEMTAMQVSFRLDTIKAHFSNSALRLGKLQDINDYKEYLQKLKQFDTDYLILTQDLLGRNFTTIDIRRFVEEKQPCLVIVDQLYDIYDYNNEKDIRKRIINVTNELRKINLETKVPFIVMAQTGREFARELKKDSAGTPELHQIQESDNPGQKATKVLTLKLSGEIMTVAIKKNRDGKANDCVHIKVNIDNGIWYELTDEELNF